MPCLFKDFAFRAEIQRAIDEANYLEATPIQEQAIPILLEGRDLIGVAETGTGKTLAFVLPIFQRLEAAQNDPQALVICPTRELAIQVAGEADRFGGHLGVRTVLAYGGTASGTQKRSLAAGCDLVVATPGRLLDFVTSAWLSLRKLRTVVLDEADRMLDMGFINDVDAILRKTPMSRQTALFSATFPDEIRRLSERYMFHPAMVKMHTGTRVADKVEHAFYLVSEEQKEALLIEILRREKPAKALIFTATREATSQVGLLLRRERHEVISLSSLLSQANRERALTSFRNGDCDMLVATDVAARGIDISDIDLVINFDVPMQAGDYVHRIGRTGRAERAGKAVTLVSERDEGRATDIERLLGETVPRVQLENFNYKPRGQARTSRRPRSTGRPAGSESGSSRRGPAGRTPRSEGSRGGRGRRRGRGGSEGAGGAPSGQKPGK